MILRLGRVMVAVALAVRLVACNKAELTRRCTGGDRASHTVVTVDTVASEFTYLGFATWKCAECGIWRVPGSSLLSAAPPVFAAVSAWPH